VSDRFQILGRTGRLSRRLIWWPWLIGPCAAGLLAGFGALGSVRPEVMRVINGPAQTYPEIVAPFLLAAAVAVYVVNSVVTRNPLSMILVGLSATLLCREVHFEWTHRGVYFMLAAVAIWALAWRRRLKRPTRDARHTSWLLATLWTYLLAFLISRRAFRFVPGEQAVHSFLEEGLETVCHVMLIVTSLLASWRRYPWTRRRKQAAS